MTKFESVLGSYAPSVQSDYASIESLALAHIRPGTTLDVTCKDNLIRWAERRSRHTIDDSEFAWGVERQAKGEMAYCQLTMRDDMIRLEASNDGWQLRTTAALQNNQFRDTSLKACLAGIPPEACHGIPFPTLSRAEASALIEKLVATFITLRRSATDLFA